MSDGDNFRFFVGRQAQRKEALARARTMRRIPHVLLGGVEHKSCSRCARLKPLTEYYPGGGADGLGCACKECLKDSKDWRIKK